MEQKSDTRSGQVTPASKWQIEALQQIDLLSELRLETISLYSSFERVLEPERVTLAKEDEKRDKADSEAIEHLRESNDIIRNIISLVRDLKSRSQV